MRTLYLTILLCVVIVLVVSAIFCHVVALATRFWLTADNENQVGFLNLGLFEACFNDYIHPHEQQQKVYDGCHNLHSDEYEAIQDWLVPGWLVACRILAIIVLILEVVGLLFVILLILWWFCKWILCDNNKRDCCERFMIYATPILFIIAGMFLMCTVMIFGDNAFRLQCKDFWVGGGDPYTNHLGYSWIIEVVACILAFLSGGFLIWLVVLKARDDI